MNIQLLSDLHLEGHPHWRPTPAPGADLLVLAGDIGSYQAGSSLEDGDFGLARFSPLAGWPTPVLYVPGNHEYDNLVFEEAHQRLQVSCQRLGLTWLERQSLVLTGADGRPVRFIGSTLWSDFESLVPVDGPLTAQMKARDKAYRAANFYLRTTHTTIHGEPFLAEQVRALSLESQQWLRDALAQPFAEGPTVVVTHFAPSLLSGDPRYGLTPGTAGFCNAMDDEFLPKAQLWLHGHLHCPSDYVKHGCRVVANPLGYARKGEQEFFQPEMCISI